MKNRIMSAILIATLITMAPAAFAGNNGEKKKAATSTEAKSDFSVRYMGEDEEHVVLQLIFTKGGNKDAYMRITDGEGSELFSERVSANQYVRYIKVSPDELKNIEVAFSTAEGDLKKRYNLNMSKVSSFKIEEVAIK